MKKFLVIYYAPVDAMQQMQNVPKEDQAKGMELWMRWAKKCGDKLVDLGNPLMNGKRLSPDGKNSDSKKEVTGYSILQASNLNEAIQLLQDHPHLGWNAACSIEVYETMPIPGM